MSRDNQTARVLKAAAVIMGLVLAGPALAQLGLPGLPSGGQPPLSLPPISPVGDLPGALSGRAGELTDGMTGDALRMAADARARLSRLVRANRRLLDADPGGAPVVRGEVLVLAPSATTLAAAARLGFAIDRRETLNGLDMTLVVLRSPQSLSARQAVEQLRRADPNGQYEYNHLYFSAGDEDAVTLSRAQAGSGPAPSIGLIDSGVEEENPGVKPTVAVQRGFAPGGVKPAAHGTAVASLLRQAAPGARLYVADVYGTTVQGGSASALVGAFNWMGEVRPAVVNVSLVGPPNRILQTAIEGLSRRGVLVVAAVGNDGPAAPPSYPASYPQVIAVTAVDGRQRVLAEAGRALHVDFAAPGAGITAARLGGGAVKVRGTSYAAPTVAAKLALASRSGGRAAVDTLSRQARDLGEPGPDKVYGRGLITLNAADR